MRFMPSFSKDQLVTYYREPLEFMGAIPCLSTCFIAQIMADGMLVGFVPKIPGSENWTVEQTVEAIATATYD